MKKIKIKNLKLLLVTFLSAFITLGDFSVPALVYGEFNNDSNKNYVEGEILVKYKESRIDLDTFSGKLKASNFNISNSLERKENIEENNISVLKIKDGKTVEEKIEELKSDPNILYAEPNYKLYPSTINSNDTYKDLLWGLDNTHQEISGYAGLLDADIDAPEAWAINEGASTIVAVIDSGVAYNHPDLIANMWDGINCKDDIGVDIVGGCNHGYDYEGDGDNTPLPGGEYQINHGTHIAGIIAATKNNGVGVIGVAPNAKIMAIRFGFTVNDEIKAINFAIQNGVKIINASYGGSGYSLPEYEAIDRFRESGGIFIAATGNDGLSNDTTPIYPASYDLDNIISVSATDQNDDLASFSNYGLTSVDIGAPGTNIYSTSFDDSIENPSYVFKSGTSMSTAYVSGLTALIWGSKPSLTATEIKNIILNTGDILSSLNGKTSTSKRINAFNAINFITSPSATITYSDVDKIVKEGDSLIITANFNEPIADSPPMKIAISGSNVVPATNMIKVSDTEYTYTHIVGSGNGVASILLSDGTDIDGNLIISNPISDATFMVNNTTPPVPVITSVATNNKISYEEKNAIHVVGTAEANSLITVILTDDVNTTTETQQLSDDNTTYNIIVNGTTATPSALINGTIHITVTATNNVNNISPIASLNVIQYPKPRGGSSSSSSSSSTKSVVIPINTIVSGCTDGALFSITTGLPCGIVNDNTPIPGCITGALFSITTGLPCGTTNSNQLLTNTPVSTSPIIRVPFSLGITRTLKLNMTGDDVKALQTYLNNLKYDCGIVDGIFGLKTKAAVILFQRTNGLIPDGVVGKLTIAKMN